MTTQEFQSKINENKEFSNFTFSSEAKIFAKENLEKVSTITSEDLGLETETYGLIYKLEDGYLIVIDDTEEDFCYFEKEIDSAQKIATDRIYELSC